MFATYASSLHILIGIFCSIVLLQVSTTRKPANWRFVAKCKVTLTPTPKRNWGIILLTVKHSVVEKLTKCRDAQASLGVWPTPTDACAMMVGRRLLSSAMGCSDWLIHSLGLSLHVVEKRNLEINGWPLEVRANHFANRCRLTPFMMILRQIKAVLKSRLVSRSAKLMTVAIQ